MKERIPILTGLKRLALAATLLAPLSAPLSARAVVVQDPHQTATPDAQHRELLKQLLGEARQAYHDPHSPAHEHVRALHRMIESRNPGLIARLKQGDLAVAKRIAAGAKKAHADPRNPAHEHVVALHRLILKHHPELAGKARRKAPVRADAHGTAGAGLLQQLRAAMHDPAHPAHDHLVALHDLIRRHHPQVIEILHHGSPAERKAVVQRVLRRAGEIMHDPRSPAHEHVAALHRMIVTHHPEAAAKLRELARGSERKKDERQPADASLVQRLDRLEERLTRLERRMSAILERYR